MAGIDQTYRDLSSMQQKLGIFKKKSQNLSRLKNDFFEKMRSAEYEEDIDKARNYYNYLYRSTDLSYKVYNRMLKELKEVSQISTSENTPSEITQLEENQAFSRFKEVYLSMHQSQQYYITQVKKVLEDIKGNGSDSDMISQIERQIEIEEELLNKLGSSHQDIFGELQIQAQIHQNLIEEKDITEKLINKIKELEKSTSTFAENLKKDVKKLKKEIKNISAQIGRHPIAELLKPAEATGEVLEKHASIFATTIITLSIAGKMGHLLGMPHITAAAHGAILLLSEVGESFQAIPFLKKLPKEAREKFQHFFSTISTNVKSASEQINSVKQMQV